MACSAASSVTTRVSLTSTPSAMMLATTPGGDAYTFAELEAMAAAGGFTRSEINALEPTFQSVVISYK